MNHPDHNFRILQMSWFASPIFHGDETRTRRAALLNVIVVLIMVLLPLVIISNLVGQNTPPLVLRLNILFWIICVATKFLINKGYIEYSSVVLLVLSFFILPLR